MEKIKIDKELILKTFDKNNILNLESYCTYYYKSFDEIYLHYNNFSDNEKKLIFNCKKNPGVLLFASANRDPKVLKFFLDEAIKFKINIEKNISAPYDFILLLDDIKIDKNFTCANISLILQNQENYNLLKKYNSHHLFIENEENCFISYLINPKKNTLLKKYINQYNKEYINQDAIINIKNIIAYIIGNNKLNYKILNYDNDTLSKIEAFGTVFCFELLLDQKTIIEQPKFKKILKSLICNNIEYMNIFLKYKDSFNINEKENILKVIKNHFPDNSVIKYINDLKAIIEKEKLNESISHIGNQNKLIKKI